MDLPDRTDPAMSDAETASDNSLFGSEATSVDDDDVGAPTVATEAIPPIPGLYVFPGLIPKDTANRILKTIIANNIFHGGALNQIMLFTSSTSASPTLPDFVVDLINLLEGELRGVLPDDVHALCFDASAQSEASSDEDSRPSKSPVSGEGDVATAPPPLARQVILNLYSPQGSLGITAHIDLPHRYADGIVGISLGWGEGIVMDFERDDSNDQAEEQGDGSQGSENIRKHSVWIPNRSVYVLSGEARWKWKHGIADRDHDVVEEKVENGTRQSEPKIRRVERDVRVSITLRWLKSGGDVLSVLAT